MAKKKKKQPYQLPNLLIFALIKNIKTPRDQINRAYAIYYWRHSRGKRNRIMAVVNFILSPLIIINDISKTTKKVKDITKNSTCEKGKIQMFLEMFYLGFFYSINSEYYYLQRFYKKDGLKRAKHFYSNEVMKHAVYKLLLNYGRFKNHNHKEVYSLGNKSSFYNFCTKNNLKTIPVEMEILSNGSIIDYLGGNKELPERDLFLKPTVDKEGKGAEIWFWDGEVYRNIEDRFLDKDSLMAHIKRLAKDHERGSILIQPLMLPHKDLSEFRINATPTIRIITYRNHQDKVKIGTGMFRFSLVEKSVVDNASAGGLMAPIDMKKGILGPAMFSDPKISNEPIESYPQHKMQIKGKEIPYWQETLTLVKKAHKHFPERYIIGWDILITQEGPILVEGNAQPGICYIQRTHGHSIGEISMGKALGYHSKKAIKLLYSGKLRKDLEDKTQVDIYNGSRLKRWINWILLREKVSVKVSIYGKVQRVGFRRWLQDKAKSYNIKGWCKNNPDGSLKAVFIGKTIDVEDLYRECYRGPDRARVDRIKVKKGKTKQYDSFVIKRKKR